MFALETLAWWTLKGSIMLVGAAIAAFLLRRRPAAVRHAVWAIAIGMQLLVPWAPRLLPAGSFGVALPETTNARFASIRSAPAASATLPFPANVRRTPAPAPEARRSAPRMPAIGTALVLVLAAGSLLHFLRLLLGWRRLAQLARSAEPVTEEEWLDAVGECGRGLRITPRVTLIRSNAIRIPVTWGIRQPQVLLPDSSRTWPAPVRRHVLLHELAHIRRRDPLWQLLAQCAVIAFWFNPVLRLAVRCMHIEAEHACDDYVLRDGERPSRYAATLVDLVSAGSGAPRVALATLSMAQRSDLETRVAAVLSPARDARVHRALHTAAIALSLALALPLAALQRVNARAASADPTCRPLMIPHFKYSQTSGSLILPDHTTLHYFFLRPEPDRWLEGSFSLDARFTADDRGVVPTLGLQALVREQRDGIDRAVYLDEVGGKLAYRYLVDGRPAIWDRKAERWFADVMPEVIRRTEAGIPDRAQRIFSRSGVEGFLAEVPRLGVVNVRRLYLLELLTLSPAELPRERLLAAARQDLAVDEPTFAAFLVDLIAREGAKADLRQQVLAELPALHRGSHRLTVLQSMVEHPDPQVQVAALENIRLLSEEVWRRDLLQAIAPQALAAGSPLVDAWFSALEHLHAPLYRRELGAAVRALMLPGSSADRLVAELG